MQNEAFLGPKTRIRLEELNKAYKDKKSIWRVKMKHKKGVHCMRKKKKCKKKKMVIRPRLGQLTGCSAQTGMANCTCLP